MKAVAAWLLAGCVVAGSAFAQCQDPASTSGRFIVRGVELVDKKTKLVWLRCPAGYTPGPQCDPSAVLPSQTFEGASHPVGGPFLPKGDWRMPTAPEWETIIARNCKYLVEPKLIDVMFDKVWTSTPAGGDQVYMIAVGGQRVASPRKLGSSEFAQAFYVRAARAEDLSDSTPAPTGVQPPTLAQQLQAQQAQAQQVQTAQASGYTKPQLQKVYTDYLAAEGYRPEVTNAGNVLFRREGRTYIVYVDEKDPTFFRLVVSFTYDDKGDEARAARLDAANFAAEQTKVIKAYVSKDASVSFSAEMFLVVPGDFKSAMPRTLRAMDYAYDKYRARLTELGKGG